MRVLDNEIEAHKLSKLGGRAISLGDSDYPIPLSNIPDSPPSLYVLGKLPSPSALWLGMVGPRRPSAYGARIGKLLAEDLAEEGVVLVSGLARGIDAVAHEAALKKGTPTVAVMACGLDRVYPPEHALLKERIVKEGGAVVSEFPLGTAPMPHHFPQRNRIISGLTRGVLLIEAGEKSGARITARLAMEQGRELFAVPGPIDSPLSIVPNHFIAEGAKLVASSADILEELLPGFVRREHADKRNIVKVSEAAKALLERFPVDERLTLEDLSSRTGQPVSQVLVVLTELEMNGVVAKQPDARYVRVLGS